MDKVHRAYARNSRDEARLIATGRVTKADIYREDRGAEQWSNWTMRKGERLGCVNGLLAFGTKRTVMMAALAKAEAGGFIIIDLEENLQSNKHAAKLLDLGLRRRHGEASMKPGQAESMQELSTAAKTKGRLPKRQAMIKWRKADLTAKQALRLMPGWTRATAYDQLGKRHVLPGRMQIEAE
jgi:hypothetical protein